MTTLKTMKKGSKNRQSDRRIGKAGKKTLFEQCFSHLPSDIDRGF